MRPDSRVRSAQARRAKPTRLGRARVGRMPAPGRVAIGAKFDLEPPAATVAPNFPATLWSNRNLFLGKDFVRRKQVSERPPSDQFHGPFPPAQDPPCGFSTPQGIGMKRDAPRAQQLNSLGAIEPRVGPMDLAVSALPVGHRRGLAQPCWSHGGANQPRQFAGRTMPRAPCSIVSQNHGVGRSARASGLGFAVLDARVRESVR